MKRLVIALILLGALCRPVRGDDAFVIHPQLFTLANGLRLYVQRVHATSDVLIGGTIEVSPAFDPPGKTGTGSIASALLASAAAPEDRARMAFGTSFSFAGTAGDFDRALAVLARGEQLTRFAPAAFTDAVVRERAAVDARASDADAVASIAFERALHAPDDPTLRLDTGASLNAIRRSDVEAYARRYFRPDRTTLVIVGDVDPATVHAAVERRFGGWRNDGPRPEIRLPPLPPVRRAVIAIPVAGETVKAHLGRPAIGRRDPDFAALNLLSAVLTGRGTQSELLVTGERGIFAVRLSASSHDIAGEVRRAKAAIRRLSTETVPVAEWERARGALLDGARTSADQLAKISALCERIADNRLPLDYYTTIDARYEAATPADGLRVARRYLRSDDDVEVYVGPFGKAARTP
jgi:zinc protease